MRITWESDREYNDRVMLRVGDALYPIEAVHRSFPDGRLTYAAEVADFAAGVRHTLNPTLVGPGYDQGEPVRAEWHP